MVAMAGIIHLTGQVPAKGLEQQIEQAFTSGLRFQTAQRHSIAQGYIWTLLPNGAKHTATSPSVGTHFCGEPVSDSPDSSSETNFINRLKSSRGVFSAFWSSEDKSQILIATDKLGVRPVYYYLKDNVLLFSSFISTFTALISELELSHSYEDVLSFLATGSYHGPATSITEIKRLEGGQYLHVTDGRVTKESYYRWDWGKVDHAGHAYARKCHRTFQQALLKRNSSANRAFCFLSGGLDSRILTSGLKSEGIGIDSYNFFAGNSQDKAYAQSYADRMGFQHRALELGELHFPNWSVLIGKAIRDENSDLANQSISVWSGDGGSVTLGGVYITQKLMALFTAAEQPTVEQFIADCGFGISKRVLRPSSQRHLARALRSRVFEPVYSSPGKPLDNFYRFLVLGDQVHHLDNHFETLREHGVELQLPFFDMELLQQLFKVPAELLAFHNFYMQMAENFSEDTFSVPWQTYPEHKTCPLAKYEGLSYQWEKRPLSKPRFRQRWHNTRDAMNKLGKPLVRELFERDVIASAMAMHLLGLSRGQHLLKMLRRVDC